MIPRRTVLCLGLSQLVCWGTSYYLIGALGERMVADLGWSRSVVYGGFSVALVAMGLSSPLIGQAIDRLGGRPVMVAGSLLSALGCAALGLSSGLAGYFAAWVCLGLAMRMTLYDAAFAALARIGGVHAKRPISQITLLGGLASTTFWPVGYYLAAALGWRGAALVYAGFGLLTVPLHMAIPAWRDRPRDPEAPPGAAEAEAEQPVPVAMAVLYTLIVTLTTFLNSGMSAHMIGILTSLGMGAALAVWVATLRGVGQSSARLCEVLFGGALHPLALGLLATGLLPLCFLLGLLGGRFVAAGVAFAFLYGAGNGLVTILRGTLPLVLFDPRVYGWLVGRLLVPSFFMSALAPLAYALVIERLGNAAALYLSLAAAGIIFAAACAMWLLSAAARRSSADMASQAAAPQAPLAERES